jgi:uncharacterized protein YoxC
MTIETMQNQLTEMEEESRTAADRVAGATRRYLNAGIGVVSVTLEKASDFRHKAVEKRIDRLAERGQSVRDRRMRRLSEAAEATRGMTTGLTRQVAGMTGTTLDNLARTTRDRLNLASSEDVESVSEQLDQLTSKLDSLEIPSAE